MKKILALIMVITLFCSTSVYAESDSTKTDCISIRLQINNVKVTNNSIETSLEAAPYIKNNFTMLPVRFVSESLGAIVTWNANLKEVTITKDLKVIILKLDDTKAMVNGETSILDAPAESIKGRTMVPLRFITENLDTSIIWNPEDKSIMINSKSCTPSVNSKSDIEQISDLILANTNYWINNDVEGYLGTLNSYTIDTKEEISKNMIDTNKLSHLNFEKSSNIVISGSSGKAVMTRFRIFEVMDSITNKLSYISKIREHFNIYVVKNGKNEWKIDKLQFLKNEVLPIEYTDGRKE